MEPTIDDDPISVGFIPEVVHVEAVIFIAGKAKIYGTFTFTSKDFDLNFDHAEQRIRDLFK